MAKVINTEVTLLHVRYFSFGFEMAVITGDYVLKRLVL